MNILLYFAVLATFLAVSCSAINCNNNRCTSQGQQQTLCLYPNPNPAAVCGQVFSVGLTNEEKNTIVNLHNQLRQRVASGKETRGNPGPQPPAANMQTLTWDDELAKVAQRWANQCTFGHDKCRDVERYKVGQNVGIRMTSGTQDTKVSDIIMMWYNEVEDFNRNIVNKYRFQSNVGHYTQIVWANTNKIGCGKIVYASNWNNYYLVCDYGPAGNVLGLPIYEIKQ
ncbi:venom allergen 3-like [Calliopsis andreniformis]|uniref:venom allergen 3-like n=1 Tax=Calliopsis andreniformis TaxID=337506 RepID=UPI003FCC750C